MIAEREQTQERDDRTLCRECKSLFFATDDDTVCPDCFSKMTTYIPNMIAEGKFAAVKDSGERRVFSTGSHRDKATGKGRFDLLPAYVLMRDARHMENGAVKYGDRNWEKGLPISCLLDSAFRHLICYLDGMRDEDHLAACRWNIGGIIWTEEMIRRGKLPAELDDMPKGVFNVPL